MADKQRIFIGLWPDATVSEALAHQLNRMGLDAIGRPVPQGNLHVTLRFLGDCTIRQIDELQRELAGVRGQAFALELDRLGWWRRSGILWAGCGRTPAELVKLEAEIGKACDRSGFTAEDRPFAPHVTVARKVLNRPNRLSIEPIAWSVVGFRLLSSVLDRQGSRYRTLVEYPLRPGVG